jgi:hypothetical protein
MKQSAARVAAEHSEIQLVFKPLPAFQRQEPLKPAIYFS